MMRLLILSIIIPINGHCQAVIWQKGNAWVDFIGDTIVSYQDGHYSVRGTYELQKDTLFITPDYAMLFHDNGNPIDLPLTVYKIPFKKRGRHATIRLLRDGTIVRVKRK